MLGGTVSRTLFSRRVRNSYLSDTPCHSTHKRRILFSKVLSRLRPNRVIIQLLFSLFFTSCLIVHHGSSCSESGILSLSSLSSDILPLFSFSYSTAIIPVVFPAHFPFHTDDHDPFRTSPEHPIYPTILLIELLILIIPHAPSTVQLWFQTPTLPLFLLQSSFLWCFKIEIEHEMEE